MKVTREAHVARRETLSTWSKETKTLFLVTETGNRERHGKKEHTVAEYPRKFLRSQQTKLW